MYRRLGGPILVALIAAFATGCGGRSPGVDDGDWYGKVVRVNVPHRKVTFEAACRLSKSGRWMALPVNSRAQVTATIAPHAHLQIYYRPSGNLAWGHGQSAGLPMLADVALHGQLPDFPPGWFVTVRDGAVVTLNEDSGLRSSGRADQRRFACVSSRGTQAFVSG
jgi:hypothetical protein